MEEFLGFGVLFILVLGAYKYTYSKTNGLPAKDDVKCILVKLQRLEDRIDKIYDKLINGKPRNDGNRN